MAKQNKPAIRFRGFTDAWEQRKLGEIVEIKDSARIPNNEWSDIGVPYIRASDISSENLKGTLFISSERYEFYKNKTGAPMRGDVLFNGGGEIGKSIICNDSKPIYVQGGAVLYARTSASNELEASYLKTYYETSHSRKYIDAASAGGTMKHFTLKPAQEMPVYLPEEEEQKQIGDFYICIDNLITLHQRKYDKLQVLKKAMLEKMFPKNGSSVPEIRFKGFTDAWEQRKFSELVQIERGGSPRPIDDFITDAPNGLNWVKIGDAPTQGNYITKTAEKIRPEGLSKTREVHPGDLILSNSMSFGKPYIMGIDGCIHDGWLLIRNTYGVFDLTFLCHLLGTPQMLSQYRSLAAGSTVNNLNKKLVGNTVVTIPSITEQRVLGDCLEQLDHLITLHQRELEKLQNIKKSMLEKMFV